MAETFNLNICDVFTYYVNFGVCKRRALEDMYILPYLYNKERAQCTVDHLCHTVTQNQIPSPL